jgi:hypothetical protein
MPLFKAPPRAPCGGGAHTEAAALKAGGDDLDSLFRFSLNRKRAVSTLFPLIPYGPMGPYFYY